MRWPCNGFPDSDERSSCGAWLRERANLTFDLNYAYREGVQTFLFLCKNFLRCEFSTHFSSELWTDENSFNVIPFPFRMMRILFFLCTFFLWAFYALPQRGGSPARTEAEISISLDANRKKILHTNTRRTSDMSSSSSLRWNKHRTTLFVLPWSSFKMVFEKKNFFAREFELRVIEQLWNLFAHSFDGGEA